MYILYTISYNEIVEDDNVAITIIDLREDDIGTIITMNNTMYIEIIQFTEQLSIQNVCILIMATTVEVYITSLIQKFYNFMPK